MTKLAARAAPAVKTRPMTEEADFLQIKAIDHVHFYVGNARHAMYYWWKAFGFRPVAYSGLETGNRGFASYVLESGNARFVVSAGYAPSSDISAHHMVHGDGVKVIALEVDDVERAWRETTTRGGKSAWATCHVLTAFGTMSQEELITRRRCLMDRMRIQLQKRGAGLLGNETRDGTFDNCDLLN